MAHLLVDVCLLLGNSPDIALVDQPTPRCNLTAATSTAPGSIVARPIAWPCFPLASAEVAAGFTRFHSVSLGTSPGLVVKSWVQQTSRDCA